MKRGLMLGLLVAIGSVMMVAAESGVEQPARMREVVEGENHDSLYLLRATARLQTASYHGEWRRRGRCQEPGMGQRSSQDQELTPKTVTLLIHTHTPATTSAQVDSRRRRFRRLRKCQGSMSDAYLQAARAPGFLIARQTDDDRRPRPDRLY